MRGVENLEVEPDEAGARLDRWFRRRFPEVPHMRGVENLEVEPDEAGARLDRWFRRRFPEVPHSMLQKWLRTGQVRVDGKRAKAGLRLAAGQTVRVPPLAEGTPPRPKPKAPPPAVSEADAAAVRALVIHRDDEVLAINKPPGLAVQGGTGVRRHLDAMLDALRFDAKARPRLVHRLDKDTSGVLLLARTAAAAARLTAAFRRREAVTPSSRPPESARRGLRSSP
jgi:23S rRNA pseudouridine955/2504/2580 synthase